MRTNPAEPGHGGSPLEAWAASGAAWLTGHADGPPLGAPSQLVPLVLSSHRRLVDAATTWSPDRGCRVDDLDALALLGERAALAGTGRAGAVSCGGSTRIYRTEDGWIAASLPRRSDLEAIPAWLGMPFSGTDVEPSMLDTGRLAGAIARLTSSYLVEQGALLGLAIGSLGETTTATSAVLTLGARRCPARSTAPLVVDLSSLWAGPLCSNLLAMCGATVVKVESIERPDGMRRDESGFFDLLTHGKRSVALDFSSGAGIGDLQRLLRRADIVIEGSRPRALAQLGVDANEMIHEGRPKIWVSVTGHGRLGDAGLRVGFGDDAAVAGGLVAWDFADQPLLVGDAAADPLAGLVAAAAVAEAWSTGTSALLDVALARVAAVAASGIEHPAPALDEARVERPRARPIPGRAPQLGADTTEVLDGLEEW